MFERFTDEARNAVVAAQREASALDHGWIGTEHLLLALLADGDGRAARVLRDFAVDVAWARGEVERIVGRGEPDLDADALATLGIDLDAVRERVERTFGRGALSRRRCRRGLMPSGALPFTARAKKALELSLPEAIATDHRRIGTEHLLLALLRERTGVAAQLLARHGVELDHVVAFVREQPAA